MSFIYEPVKIIHNKKRTTLFNFLVSNVPYIRSINFILFRIILILLTLIVLYILVHI